MINYLTEKKMSFSHKYILVLNTAVNHYLGAAIFKINNGEFELIAKTWRKVKYKQSENLLLLLDNILEKKKINKNDLSGLSVVVGPGSFAAVRIGVALANTWGLINQIPVFAYKIKNKELLAKKEWKAADWSKTLEDMVLYFKKIKILKQVQDDNGKKFKPVLPVYNGEAKIGKKK